MKFTPFCVRIVMNKEVLPNSDGKMMSHAEIEIRMHEIERWLAIASDGNTQSAFYNELQILRVILGRRKDNELTCAEHSMDVEWNCYNKRPAGYEE